ncbi:MAG: phosphopantetheine adenylyltransferase [Gammaproteobacteria bacterium]
MKILTAAILVVVGMINFLPILGITSAATLERLYGIAVTGPDVEILLRHRAVLFGMLGALLIVSAFQPKLQKLAVVAGAVSLSSFILIALLVGDYGDAVRNVVIIDVVALIALLIVPVLHRSTRNPR